MAKFQDQMLERLNDRMNKTRTLILNMNKETRKDREAIECQEYLLRALTEIKYGSY